MSPMDCHNWEKNAFLMSTNVRYNATLRWLIPILFSIFIDNGVLFAKLTEIWILTDRVVLER